MFLGPFQYDFLQNVTDKAVLRWERGTSDPSTSNLFALAKLFGISVGELLEEVQERTDKR